MFPNLEAELARKRISRKHLMDYLDISSKTINNKLEGRTEFTWKEILKISELFPNLELKYLFFPDNENKTA